MRKKTLIIPAALLMLCGCTSKPAESASSVTTESAVAESAEPSETSMENAESEQEPAKAETEEEKTEEVAADEYVFQGDEDKKFRDDVYLLTLLEGPGGHSFHFAFEDGTPIETERYDSLIIHHPNEDIKVSLILAEDVEKEREKEDTVEKKLGKYTIVESADYDSETFTVTYRIVITEENGKDLCTDGQYPTLTSQMNRSNIEEAAQKILIQIRSL